MIKSGLKQEEKRIVFFNFIDFKHGTNVCGNYVLY